MQIPGLQNALQDAGLFPALVTQWYCRPNPAVMPVGHRIRVPEHNNAEYMNNGSMYVRVGSAPFAQSGVASSVTGTTAETTLASIVIPGGMMGPNGQIRVTFQQSHTNNANVKAARVRLGGTELFNFGATTSSAMLHTTCIRNRGSLASQVANTAGNFGAILVATGAVNTAIDQTLTITGALANAADTMTIDGYTVEVLPA